MAKGSAPPQDSEPTGPVPLEDWITLYHRNVVFHLPEALHTERLLFNVHGVSLQIVNKSLGLRNIPSSRPRIDKTALIKLIGTRYSDELFDLVESDDKDNVHKAVTIILSRAIVTRLDPDGDPDTTLLPPDVLRLYQELKKRFEHVCKYLCPASALWNTTHVDL